MSQNPNTPQAWGILLSKLWMLTGQDFPVNAKKIALEVMQKKFDDPISNIKGHDISGIEGMLSKSSDGKSWYILYDETIESAGRINFTLSHELGHYLLHRKLQDEFKCGQSYMLDYNSPQSKALEKEANKFASYLLMPINDFRSQVNGEKINLDLLSYCANRYDVSFTAAAIKWAEFTDETAIVVMARDEFICWSYPSQKARKLGIYYTIGTPLPAESISSLWLTNSSIKRSAGVWHKNFECVESAIVSDKYDMAIFLIVFSQAHHKEYGDEKESNSIDIIINKAHGLI